MEQKIVFAIEIFILLTGSILIFRRKALNEKIEKAWSIINENPRKIEVLVVVITFLSALAYIYDGHDWGDDFSAYLAQAIALSDGTLKQHVELMRFIQENSIAGTYPVICSWGLPAILAVLYRIFGFQLIVFRSMGAVCLTIFVYAVYSFLSKRFDTKDTFIAILFFIACKHYMEAGTSILTDIPCAMFTMIAVHSLCELMKSDGKKQYLWSSIFGCCTFAAYQLRSPGIVLLLTLACIQVILFLSGHVAFIKKQIQRTNLKNINLLAHCLPYAIFFLGNGIVSVLLPQAGNDYVSFIQYAPSDYVFSNMRYYLTILRDFFDVGNYLAVICGFVLLILIILGMAVKFHQEIISEIFVLGTMAMLYLTPFVSSVRYLFYLYPFFLMFAFYGAKWLVEKLAVCKRKSDGKLVLNILRYCAVCVCGFMMVFSLRMIWKIHTRPQIDSAYAPEALEAYEWIMEQTDEDDIILFFKPRALWLNAHRYSYNTYDDVRDLDRADYVFFFIKDNFYHLREYVTEHPVEYVLEFDNGNFQIYKYIGEE